MTQPEQPPTPDVLHKADILAHIGEVGDELASQGLTGTLVVVGGSYMALHDLRDSTADVDSVTRLSDEIKAVITTIATRHGLRPDWLNDNAAMFSPAGLNEDDCDVLFQHTNLTILGPPAVLHFR